MKISQIESARAEQIASATNQPVSPATGASPAGSGSGPAASLQLSPQAQALSAARAEAAGYVSAVNAVPDRSAQIEQLRSQIAAGTYSVSSKDIATQIVRRAQADQIS